MSKEALQKAEERKEAKGKGERERYIQQTAQFQRIIRRDKKAFLSGQCKKKKKKPQIEENNRLGKTREIFKEIEGIKETFHARRA